MTTAPNPSRHFMAPPAAHAAPAGRPGMAVWTVVTLALMLAALAAAFLYAPTERTMGIYQRIFYIHVPAAFSAWAAFALNCGASLAYLWRRSPKADAWAVAGAEVGLTLLSVNLISGPIWARPIWGVWWVWDPRLTLTLVMWVMYASYLLLRQMTPPGELQPRLAAALSMFFAVGIPIDYMAIRWWRGQHPAPVLFSSGGYLDPRMGVALGIGMAAFLSLTGLLLVLRYRQQLLARQLLDLQRTAALREDADASGRERAEASVW